MINYYFGLPGCGKTTHLVATALRENSRINKGISKFERILTNVRLSVPDGEESNIYLIDNDDIGKYDMSLSLILLDEVQMIFDSRDYKSLSPERRNFLMLHRHYKTVIHMYNQIHDGVDKKIRYITNNVYYLKRNLITGKTTPHRIKYVMYIPKKPRRNELVQASDASGDITMRYYQTGFFEHLFSKLLIERPVRLQKYYSSFDSYEAPALPFKEFEKL